jgi:thiol-disulfide isomerase/thioredoxin
MKIRTLLSLLRTATAAAALLFAAPAFAGSIQQELDNKLVALDGKRVKSFDDAKLSGVTHFAIYYSAHWCPPCRRFTPELVEAYKALKAKYPKFELIFVSSDRSEKDMEAYMEETGMPWPALKFDEKKRTPALTSYAGPGIPCLVFIDNNAKVISHSYAGEEYLGPQKVLADIEKVLAVGGAPAR